MVQVKRFAFRKTFGITDMFAAIAAFCVLSWLALPSSFFLRPASYSIETDIVIFEREVPHGQVSANWVTEIRSHGKECSASGGPSIYQTSRSGERLHTVRYPLQVSLKPCIGRGSFDVSQTHTVLLFGAVPLRATETLWRCTANDGTLCERLL